MGNRTRTVENGVATVYSANSLNEYINAGAAVLTYDADGNLSRRVEGASVVMYSYDAQNRLTGVVSPGGTWSYEYDAFGNRTAAVHDDLRVEYLLDPMGFVDTVGEYDGAGNIVAHYTHGHQLVRKTNKSGQTDYFQYDGMGSTVGTADEKGNYMGTRYYDPFGRGLFDSSSAGGIFRYAGGFGLVEDGEGLVFSRARPFDVNFGRFITADPLVFRLEKSTHTPIQGTVQQI